MKREERRGGKERREGWRERKRREGMVEEKERKELVSLRLNHVPSSPCALEEEEEEEEIKCVRRWR